MTLWSGKYDRIAMLNRAECPLNNQNGIYLKACEIGIIERMSEMKNVKAKK